MSPDPLHFHGPSAHFPSRIRTLNWYLRHFLVYRRESKFNLSGNQQFPLGNEKVATVLISLSQQHNSLTKQRLLFPPVSCASVWLWNPRGAITLLEEAASGNAPEYFSMELCLFSLSGIKCSSVQRSHLPREVRVRWILCGVLGNPCTMSPQAWSLPGSPPPPPGNLLGGVSVPIPPLAFLLFPSYWFWTKNKGSRDCISRQDLALPEITVYLFVRLKGKSKFLLSFFPLKLLCFRPNPRPGRAEQRKLCFLGRRDFILCISPTVKLWMWAIPFLHT